MASERVQRQIDRLLDQAEAAIATSDWATVGDRARNVLRLDPDNSDALSYLATAERDLRNTQPAQTNLSPAALATDHPTSFANGRYQVQRFLGEGGKKKAYLAHDTLLDQEVAFALIKTEGLDETSRTRITREAQAMGRLGSHPHIVTVFDLGQEADQPYMVTELMGGGDVEGLIETATDQRLPLEQAIKIAQETCQGLEFAHGRGVVHRDLKPGNVWLTNDGTAKIGDFGLAVSLDRSRLTTEGTMVGTHSLIQETLAGELNTTRRVRLHARIAEALEQSYGLEAEAHASELSFHFGEAASLLGSQKLISYSILAGEQALATYAHEDALAYFQKGLSAKEGQPMDGETASLLFGLGRAQAAMFRRREALDCLIRAFDFYAEAGDVDRAVAVSEYPINPGIGRVRVTPLLERALAMVPPDSHEEGGLLSRYGLALATEMGDYQRAQEALNRALEFATRESDSTLEMRTWANAALVDMYYNRVRDGVEKAIKATGLAPVAGDLRAEANVSWAAAFGFLALGEVDSARYHAKISVDLAERLRDRSLLASAYIANGVLHRFLGAWEESRTLSERGLGVAARDPRIKVTLAILEYEVGNFAEGEVHLDSLLEIMRQTTSGPTVDYGWLAVAIPMVSRISGNLDRLEVAREAAETILSYPSALPLIACYARAGLWR